MIALSAKNGILIVEMAREGRMVHGKPILEAAVEASRSRFRPILMTSFAFGLGVVPLVLATGAGANGRISLGLSVLSGIIASTCLACCSSRRSSPSCKASTSGARRGKKPRFPPPAPRSEIWRKGNPNGCIAPGDGERARSPRPEQRLPSLRGLPIFRYASATGTSETREYLSS